MGANGLGSGALATAGRDGTVQVISATSPRRRGCSRKETQGGKDTRKVLWVDGIGFGGEGFCSPQTRGFLTKYLVSIFYL